MPGIGSTVGVPIQVPQVMPMPKPLEVTPLNFVDGRSMAGTFNPNAMPQGVAAGAAMMHPLAEAVSPQNLLAVREAGYALTPEGQQLFQQSKEAALAKMKAETLQSQMIANYYGQLFGGGALNGVRPGQVLNNGKGQQLEADGEAGNVDPNFPARTERLTKFGPTGMGISEEHTPELTSYIKRSDDIQKETRDEYDTKINQARQMETEALQALDAMKTIKTGDIWNNSLNKIKLMANLDPNIKKLDNLSVTSSFAGKPANVKSLTEAEWGKLFGSNISLTNPPEENARIAMDRIQAARLVKDQWTMFNALQAIDRIQGPMVFDKTWTDYEKQNKYWQKDPKTGVLNITPPERQTPMADFLRKRFGKQVDLTNLDLSTSETPNNPTTTPNVPATSLSPQATKTLAAYAQELSSQGLSREQIIGKLRDKRKELGY
jgi:hypothetical protein